MEDKRQREVYLKIAIMGDIGVGRASIVRRFVHGTYTDNAARPSGELCNCVTCASS